MNAKSETNSGKCPVMHTFAGVNSNRDWWPNQLNLKLLQQNCPQTNPLGETFDYAEAFMRLDLAAVVRLPIEEGSAPLN